MFEGTNLPAHGSDGVTPVASAVRACDREHVRWRWVCGVFSRTQSQRTGRRWLL